jgi:hypothetical protein
MGALTFSFTKTEQLSITGITAWGTNNATLTVSNTGASTFTISAAKIDGVLATPTFANNGSTVIGVSWPKGVSANVKITGSATMSSGVQYNFELDTKAGHEYPYTATHP